jgi:hypothetical protein
MNAPPELPPINYRCNPCIFASMCPDARDLGEPTCPLLPWRRPDGEAPTQPQPPAA